MTKVVPLKGVRGMIADAMTKSLATGAQLTHHGSADATALMAEKTRLGAAGTKISVEDLLMLAVVRALSHKLLVLQHGRIVEYGDAARIFDAPQAEYTRELLNAAFFYQKPTTTI